MNVFELFSTITLDKSGYEKGLKSASVLTKTEAEKMKNSLLELKNANKTAMDNLIKDFASGKINITDYNKELSKIKSSNSEIENTAKSMGISLEDSAKKSALAWGAVATAIVAVGKKIDQLMQQSLQYADQMGDLAAKYGTTSEAISEMAYVATQAGSDVNTLANAMSMLYMRAKQDGEAFQSLGVSVKDANGNFKSMDDLFWETVYAMNDLDSEGEKSAYMFDLFGRSASNIGEILRKDSSELEEMRKRAHDLGIVVNQTTADFAGSWFDKLDELKLQGQSVLASIAAGAPDAEEKLQSFFDNIMTMLERYVPTFVNFALRIVIQAAIALVRISPSLIREIINAIIDTILNVNWLQVGIDVGKAILEGLLNCIIAGLNSFLKIFGVNIPKIDFDVGQNYFENLDTSAGNYEISENSKQDINISIEASGDTAVSKESAEKTAEALAPYIDKILGGK